MLCDHLYFFPERQRERERKGTSNNLEEIHFDTLHGTGPLRDGLCHLVDVPVHGVEDNGDLGDHGGVCCVCVCLWVCAAVSFCSGNRCRRGGRGRRRQTFFSSLLFSLRFLRRVCDSSPELGRHLLLSQLRTGTQFEDFCDVVKLKQHNCMQFLKDGRCAATAA